MRIIINNEANVTKEMDNCLWYGGLVVSIETEDGVYEIVARGIVDCELIAKNDFIDDNGIEYKKGNLIARVKDKNEYGAFEREFKQYIKNDERLSEILNEQDEFLELVMSNNNWLELSFFNNNDECEYEDILDDSSILSALDTVINLIKEKRNFKDNKYSVYCRTASFDAPAIEKQKQLCLKEMELDNTLLNENDINIYVDNGFSSTEDFSPALKILFEDMKVGKEKRVYTTDISRLTRNIMKMFDIRVNLEENNSDIFLVREHEYLYNDLFSKTTIPQLSKLLNKEIRKKELEFEEEMELEK